MSTENDRESRADGYYNVKLGGGEYIAQLRGRKWYFADDETEILEASIHGASFVVGQRMVKRQIPGYLGMAFYPADDLVPTPKLVALDVAQEATLEARIAARPAPKVTPADIEAEIVCETYFTADQGAIHAGEPYHDALTLLTFCVLVLHNGFTVTGESACASPENFNAEVGRKVARANAVSKCWALLGFRLRDELQEMAERAVREREALKMVRGEDAFGAPEDAA